MNVRAVVAAMRDDEWAKVVRNLVPLLAAGRALAWSEIEWSVDLVVRFEAPEGGGDGGVNGDGAHAAAAGKALQTIYTECLRLFNPPKSASSQRKRRQGACAIVACKT